MVIFPLESLSKECDECHDKKIFEQVEQSIHSSIKCIKCHPNVKGVTHPTKRETKVDCGKCHVESVKVYFTSIHGRALKMGIEEIPDCVRCHGGHVIFSVKDKRSKVYRENIVALCTSCHTDEEIEKKCFLPGVEFIKAYEKSIHSSRRNGKIIAVCSDCHGSHAILPLDDPMSLISKKKHSFKLW